MKSKSDQLVNAWIEGELSPEDEETLRALLTEDASLRESCYDLMLLDQMLAEREEGQGANIAELVAPSRKHRTFAPRTAIAAVASLAAAIVAGFWITNRQDDQGPIQESSPSIIASSDSRIIIAQREGREKWSPGELLRLERGTAAIHLGKGVLGHFEGPAAIELVNAQGDIRLFEGRGSFQVDAGGHTFNIEAPGGTVRGSGTRFICQILPDQAALVEVNAGSLELAPHTGRGPSKITAEETVRLEGNGSITPTARPSVPFRAGLPEELALFHDDFKAADGTLISDHVPQTGQKWEVLEEVNPTAIRKERLDTSSGARRLLARVATHDPGGTGSVYVFSFSLLPPEWSSDKIRRMDGIESIAIVDPEGRELFSLVAEAVDIHRWQLKGGGQVSPRTSVCALWDHQLTVCYGLDGRVTLHDGGTAQAPVIASIWLKDPAPVEGFVISNRTGGDLAFRRISTSLLRAPSVHAE
jgi:hypothetical protein